MHPERWRRLDAVVQQAMERPPDRRRELLREACGDDEELLREAASLLEAEALAGDFLATAPDFRSAAPLLGGKAAEPVDLGPGDRLGPYRLIRAIGEGGMGIVYLAERADEAFEQRVAIKVGRREAGPPGIESRLKAERQILAGLDHPGVARLFDGGSSEGGHPYLVMEVVDGVPIDDYCDRRRLGVRSRLELFLGVCSAVQYAHQNLVVHRDLKPSNVLVTAEGVPKLLDFGVAKLLQPSELPFPVEPTRTGQRALTPAYASPEQLTGRRVTTASDVYSLGVILYRLLTGRLPRRFSGLLPADVAEMLREPTRPSVAVLAGDRASEEAGLRGASPAQLARQLRGDLDNVVLKALDADAARRYPSAAALEDDLRRHLEGRTVRARPPSWRYSAGRFLRRNRLAAAATAAFVAVLLAFTATTVVQRARLALERDRAQQERERAEEVTDLVVEMFEVAAPDRPLGRDVSVREVLDRRAGSLAAEFADRPELLATLQAKMGDLYRRIGAYSEAASHLEAALETRRASLRPDDPLLAQTLSDLGAVYGVQGRFREAAELFERSVAILRATPRADPAVLVPALGRLAIARSKLGDPEGSEHLSREILGIQERRFGPESREVAYASFNLGVHKALYGDLAAARELFERALAVQERLLPEDHPDRLRSHLSLGQLLLELGRHEPAREHLAVALEGQERILGPDHDQVGETLRSLGDLLRVTGDLDGADALYRRAQEVYDRGALGAGHPQRLLLGRGRALLAAARGRSEEAERLAREVVDLRRGAVTGPGFGILVDLGNLAGLCLGSGRLDEAGELLSEAEWAAAGLRPSPRLDGALARVLLARGRLHELRDQSGAAVAAYRRAVAHSTEAAAADRDVRAVALRRLSELGAPEA